MIDLYTAGTGNGRRASIMLEECGLSYNVHKIDLAKGDQKTPQFLKLNPLGAIPVIVDADGPGGKPVTLSQSGAIVLYLADKTGKFLPTDKAKRATALQWFMHASTDVAPASTGLFLVTNAAPDKVASIQAYFETRLLNIFRGNDQRLGEVEYLAGDYSIADIAFYPVVLARKDLIDKTDGLTNLKRWAAKVGARPGVAKGAKVPA
ncbi:MAG: glutathione S-transferase N-terminal domain-containing protein [Proteobacteria bacterium]|nr:glutathione S-transferase N-terminal domain-containing protein [Pseudomonadota bacterium]